ncbi:VP4 [American grass carp reovirus]|uniref:Outer capsid protein VP4 n=1 Tax=Aquareovirus G (isolate American grass carp/USA/PB01-155/-) TaxID=648234 RepID=VP4_AQRVG|nr:VP4 [American grass carp reovirus]B2BNE4.1 RecName: Full=Outer capsid protein VP4 [American grass carp reovirus PB01-155]ABV01044.1 VP4 [American grass carp reovirus]
MGNVQTSTNVYNIDGNGNTFAPSSQMASTASPAIDLKPGVLNPTGKLWQTMGTGAPSADSLVLVVDNKGEYTYLSENMRETLNKAVTDVNMWQPLFQATKSGCGPVVLANFTTISTGYVGATADDAFSNGLVSNGPFLATMHIMELQKTIAARMRDVAIWQKHLDTAMTLMTPDVSAGDVTCKWRSLLEFAQDILPLDNLCRSYPNEFYTVAAQRYPAIRPGQPDTQVALPQPHPLGEVAGSFNAPTSEVGSLVGAGAALSDAISTLASKDLDLVEADTPLPVSVFTPSLAPRTYRPAFIDPQDAAWIAQWNGDANIRIITTYQSTDYTVQLGPGPTRVIDMNAMIDAKLTLDVSGTILPFQENNDLSSAIPAFVLIQTKVPLHSVTQASDVEGITVVSAAESSAINLSVNVRGDPRFDMLHLHAMFERETIAGIPYIYGIGTFLIPSITSSSSFCNPTLMDGELTVTPLLLRETTYKGAVVDTVTPSEVMANQTSEEVASALANDAVLLVSGQLERLATVVGDVIPIASGEDDAATSAIVGRLAIEATMRARHGGDTRALPNFGQLWKRAKRAASMFASNPALALQVGVPVLADSGILSALTSGVSTAIRTGSLGKGVSDASSKLNARQSLTLARKTFFKKVEELWPSQ